MLRATIASAGIGGLKAGPNGSQVQRAADGQHRVAQDLGLQPLRRLAPEQAIVGIELRLGRVERRALLIDGARQDQPVQPLEPPAAARRSRAPAIPAARDASAARRGRRSR